MMKHFRSWFLMSLIAGLMSVASIAGAQHEHEEDLMISEENGQVKIIEPDEIVDDPYTRIVEWTEVLPGSLYVFDQGFRLFIEEGANAPVLRSVRILQLEISNDLFGIAEEGGPDPIFGPGTPGFLDLEFDPNEPDESDHQHVIFSALDNRTRMFKFRLVNGVLADGTALADSVDYTLVFVPEPASMGALLTGIGAIALRSRRRPRA